MGRAEILGLERRRTWSDEDKLRILAEADAPEISIASVARRHDLCPQQLYPGGGCSGMRPQRR
jgi:transposase